MTDTTHQDAPTIELLQAQIAVLKRIDSDEARDEIRDLENRIMDIEVLRAAALTQSFTESSPPPPISDTPLPSARNQKKQDSAPVALSFMVNGMEVMPPEIGTLFNLPVDIRRASKDMTASLATISRDMQDTVRITKDAASRLESIQKKSMIIFIVGLLAGVFITAAALMLMMGAQSAPSTGPITPSAPPPIAQAPSAPASNPADVPAWVPK